MLESVVAKLNERELFHTLESTNQVKILAAPSNMSPSGKKLLKDHFGFKDFTVPASKTSELLQKVKDMPVTKGTHGDDWNKKETVKFGNEKQGNRKKHMGKNDTRSKKTVNQKDLAGATKTALKKGKK